MKLTDNAIRLMSVLATQILFVVGAFGFIAAPQSTAQETAATDWRFIITVALFAVAGVIIVVWAWRRISKRSTK